MNNLDISGVRQGFLRLNFMNSGKQDEFPVPGEAGIPTVRNFSFTNVRVHDVPMLVQATEISARKPLLGFTLANVTGTCGKGIFLANVHQAVLRNIKVTGYEGALLHTANVSGMGLNGAVAIVADALPKAPEVVPEPETPYKLH